MEVQLFSWIKSGQETSIFSLWYPILLKPTVHVITKHHLSLRLWPILVDDTSLASHPPGPVKEVENKLINILIPVHHLYAINFFIGKQVIQKKLYVRLNRPSYVEPYMCDLGNQSEVELVPFSAFYLIEILIRRGTFCWKNPPESDQWFQSYSNWKILKTIENKRNAFLFLAVSHDQCFQLPTDPTRSQHICRGLAGVLATIVWVCFTSF